MKLLSRLSLCGAVMAFIVIVLGAWVRLSDAGLGCPDWPGCYGTITVPQGEEIAAANEAYPALLALVIFQGMLGMWTVTLLVKPAVVTAHLFGGLTTLSLLWIFYLRNSRAERPSVPGSDANTQLQRTRPVLWLALVVLAGQIFLGGWTSTNYAALSCPDFPTCQGQWWPAMNFDDAFQIWRGVGVDYEGGVLANESRVAIHISHRIGAIIATLVIALAAFAVIKRADQRRDAALGRMLLGVLALQVGLGISNIVFHLPLSVATAHNGGAALLVVTLVTLLYRARRHSGA